MARKGAEKKSYKKNYSKIILVILMIIIFAISSIAAVLYQPSDKNNEPKKQNNETNESDGKWLFAMDTAQVQYLYQASGIPTLVIIDKNGEYIFYSQGAQVKEQLDPYIDRALKGTAESYGEVPDFTVTTFDNQNFTLSEYKGKVVILDIMGVGCPPCVMQMPELQKIKKERGSDITILSIDTYYSGETKEDVIETYGEYIKT